MFSPVGATDSWRQGRRVAMVPALAHMPLQFLVGSLAESLTDLAGFGRCDDARLSIAYSSTACRQGSLSPIGKGRVGRSVPTWIMRSGSLWAVRPDAPTAIGPLEGSRHC